jgi:hypothetical protein
MFMRIAIQVGWEVQSLMRNRGKDAKSAELADLEAQLELMHVSPPSAQQALQTIIMLVPAP